MPTSDATARYYGTKVVNIRLSRGLAMFASNHVAVRTGELFGDLTDTDEPL